MKKIALNLLKNISALSFGIAVLSANSASSWVAHQAKEPQALQKLKITLIKGPLLIKGEVLHVEEEICLKDYHINLPIY